eukprot:6749066-Alexandrium_andersonii.AAC.1
MWSCRAGAASPPALGPPRPPTGARSSATAWRRWMPTLGPAPGRCTGTPAPGSSAAAVAGRLLLVG